MEPKKLTLPEIVRHAQQASGGDCFGIGNDPEAIQVLTKMAAERFRTTGSKKDLEAWALDVLDLADERFAWWREENGSWLRAQRNSLLLMPDRLPEEIRDRLERGWPGATPDL